MTGLKGQEEPAHRSSWKLFKGTDELKEQRGAAPPPATCLKEQDFIKFCHTVFVSQGEGGGDGGGDGGGLLEVQSCTTEELLTLLHHQ